MLKILHISRMNFLSNKAHVYTTSKTCESFSMQKDIEVSLLSSDDSLSDDVKKEDFFNKHSIRTKFNIISLDSYANRFKGSSIRFINWIETLLVNISVSIYIIKNRKNFDILYYRDTTLFAPILISKFIFHKPIFIEIHAVLHKKHGQKLNDWFSKISNGLIAISHGLRRYYQKINSNIIVAFCAASEVERFESIKESKEDLRKELGLPMNKNIIMYSGNLYKTGNYDSYGIEDIVNAIPYLDESFIFVGVGKKGNETKGHEDLAKSLNVSDRVLFLPWVSKQEVYRYWKASDILILPASGAQIGNSPTKMFEYLVSRKPIVSALTEPIVEVLNNKNSILVKDYKDPEEWARAINKVFFSKGFKDSIVEQSLIDSNMYTWQARGASIIEFIKKTIKYEY